MPVFILMRERKGVDMDGLGSGEGLGGVGGRETKLRVCCISIFNKNK